MGLSVGPRVGTDYLMTGDAGGSINPFNGEGIAYGYETGRLAASCAGEALASSNLHLLGRYEEQLEQTYGLYYKVASAFMRLPKSTPWSRCTTSGSCFKPGLTWPPLRPDAPHPGW